MKVIVSQYGARRRYMIPQILNKAGLLEALYTDSNSQSRLGHLAKLLCKILPGIARLSKRQTNLPFDKVKSNDWLQWNLLRCKFGKDKDFRTAKTIFEGSSSRFIKWGTRNADWLYTMFIENFKFVEFAKNNGVKVIADIYEDPYIWDELMTEIELPEYRSIKSYKTFYEAQSRLRHQYVDNLLSVADQYIVPSEYVLQSINRSPGFSLEKVNLVPYTSSVKNTYFQNKPVRGRIIWVGNDPVRKGLAYFGRAAAVLKEKFPFVDCRVIGVMPGEMSQSLPALNFIGYCDKTQLSTEYSQADMFVFPTLAEGFAGVLLEAAGFGVPIITTKASGLPSDAPGIFVEKRDVNELVRQITLLIEDREYRDSMARSMFEYSQNLKNVFEERLLNILNSK